jgi:hypothetical protein
MSQTTQYQEALQQTVENEYLAKHLQMSIRKPSNDPSSNLVSAVKPSGFGHPSVVPYDLSSDDDEYLVGRRSDERTPR